jgi:phosphoribosylformylglycinamidine synthase
MNVRRVYVEKKNGFDVEAEELFSDLKQNLSVKLDSARVLCRYDIADISDEVYQKAKFTIFSEPPVDHVYDEDVEFGKNDRVFAIEFLPGQYDQRADSASQCVQILTEGERPEVKAAKIVVLSGNITDEEFAAIKKYCINPVDSREADLSKFETLKTVLNVPQNVEIIKNFINMNDEEVEKLMNEMGLAMSFEDLKFCKEYFKNTEKRDPYLTEIRVIDTYWSDHCRHTTFLTEIKNVEFEEGAYTALFKTAFEEYKKAREYVCNVKEKPMCLMDMAIIGMKELKKSGKLDDLEVSDEINACSIVVNVDVDGKDEEWLVMFKNETHNHPTEIEPFGGAATCLGGSIRDPLSGRAYVYQAMRVTGSGDPRTKLADTLSGKLPQRKITRGAAHGYSSYGNQIGLATGQVTEVYDEGFVAKRMEIGAVIAAAPRENVIRETSDEGDIIVLLGGRTGRDGCGGATGSSKEHNEESILTCGAEVQKGNAPTERKIQRLFRNPIVSKLIKKCNDFGAGGISVAIGELADGLLVDLDAVPKKYEGLDGTELAISESQERMAVVLDPKDVDLFIEHAHEENLEAVRVAVVTADKKLKMNWKGTTIVDIKREFLDTNGVRQITDVFVKAPIKADDYFTSNEISNEDIKNVWLNRLKDLNVCSQKGLVERFDSSIGAGTVLTPFGGKYQLTPSESMAAKIPLVKGDTKTGTLMSFGYNPLLSKWSPFHGGLYAVIESVAKIVANGGEYQNIRLTCQEYFEKLGKDAEKWGNPFAALLGAYYAQKKLSIPSIGGKDSMSGTFKDLTVPPTLVSFAVDVVNVGNVITQEFKSTKSTVILIKLNRDEFEMPDFGALDKNFKAVNTLIKKGKVLSAHTVKMGGILEAVTKMSFGNKIGMTFATDFEVGNLVSPDYGSIILEVEAVNEISQLLSGIDYSVIGNTTKKAEIKISDAVINIDEAISAWESPLEKIFPTNAEVAQSSGNDKISTVLTQQKEDFSTCAKTKSTFAINTAKPRIFIPVFPGTNCEYDSRKAFENAGGIVDTFVIKNLTPNDIEDSIEQITKKINNSQIVMLPGGFSAGDEPEGSGKFIAAVFRNPSISEAVMKLLKERDGLMLGICNGFQALIKLGLVPYGEIRDMDESCPTLTFNTIGRHVSNYVNTRVVSKLSPWFNNVEIGDMHSIPVSHGEGRFWATEDVMKNLIANGQVATQYVDFEGNPTYDISYNPNGSYYSVEGITSPDGRVLGKMGHSERVGENIAKNIYGDKYQKLFESGVEYFK